MSWMVKLLLVRRPSIAQSFYAACLKLPGAWIPFCKCSCNSAQVLIWTQLLNVHDLVVQL